MPMLSGTYCFYISQNTLAWHDMCLSSDWQAAQEALADHRTSSLARPFQLKQSTISKVQALPCITKPATA